MAAELDPILDPIPYPMPDSVRVPKPGGLSLKLKTYQAWSMPEAIAFVKRDLGDDAVILHTRTFERGGFFGFRKRTVVEITAGRAAEMPAEARAPAAPLEPVVASRPSGARAAAVGAYASAGRGGVAGGGSRASDPAEPRRTAGPAASRPVLEVELGSRRESARESTRESTREPTRESIRESSSREGMLDMEVERERTRRLAQAMAIKFDRIEEETQRRAGASERAAAATNERAVEAATRPSDRRESRAAEPRPQVAVNGAAQRFVLVPESRGDARTGTPAKAPAEAIATRVEWPAPPASDESRAVEVDTVKVDTVKVEVSAVRPMTALAATTPAPGATAAASRPSVVVAPPVARSAAPTERPSPVSRELDAISNFVGRVLERGDAEPSRRVAASGSVGSPRPPHADAPSPVEAAVFARLIGEEVAQDLARRLAAEIAAELEPSGEAIVDPDSGALAPAAVAALRTRITALLPADGSSPFAILPGRHGPRRIAFIGPTGVGKTTTLAKVAAQLKLHRGLSVGIVAADTYRIAAVDQLRTYAEILGLPIEVAASPREAAEACARLGEVDVILIDTAGRSQNDCMKLSELRAFLAAAAPDETHLVLSATAGARTLAREAEAFGQLGVDRLALTKLDEAAAFGTLVSLVAAFGKPLSFLTHGQEVPDHIEEARGTRLATLLLASGDGVRDLRSPMSR